MSSHSISWASLSEIVIAAVASSSCSVVNSSQGSCSICQSRAATVATLMMLAAS